MSYSVNWHLKEVFIPVSDMELIGGTEYRLPISNFYNEIRRLESSFDEGLWSLQVLEVVIIGTLSGTLYEPIYKIVNGYKIILDPLATRVIVVGGNTNISDVQIVNGVSLTVNQYLGGVVSTGGTGDLQLSQEIRATVNEINDNNPRRTA